MTIVIEIKSSNNLSSEELHNCVELLEQYFSLPHLTNDQVNSVHRARTLWILAKENSDIVGLATLTPDKEDNLKNILVIPSYRNKGICNMILTVVQKLYNQHKNKMHVPCLTVLKDTENTLLLKRIYEKKFYKITKETQDKIFMTLNS